MKHRFFDFDAASGNSDQDSQPAVAANGSSSVLRVSQQTGHRTTVPLMGMQVYHLSGQYSHPVPVHGLPAHPSPDTSIILPYSVNPAVLHNPPSPPAAGTDTSAHRHSEPGSMSESARPRSTPGAIFLSRMPTSTILLDKETPPKLGLKRKGSFRNNPLSDTSRRKRPRRDDVQEGPSSIPLQRSSSPEDAQPHIYMPTMSFAHNLPPPTTRNGEASSSAREEVPRRSSRQRREPLPLKHMVLEEHQCDQMRGGPESNSNQRLSTRPDNTPGGVSLSREHSRVVGPGPPYGCTCGVNCQRIPDLNRHIDTYFRANSGSSPHCPAAGCQKSFSRTDSLKRHMLRKVAKGDTEHEEAYPDDFGEPSPQKKGLKKEDQSRKKR